MQPIHHNTNIRLVIGELVVVSSIDFHINDKDFLAGDNLDTPQYCTVASDSKSLSFSILQIKVLKTSWTILQTVLCMAYAEFRIKFAVVIFTHFFFFLVRASLGSFVTWLVTSIVVSLFGSQIASYTLYFCVWSVQFRVLPVFSLYWVFHVGAQRRS